MLAILPNERHDESVHPFHRRTWQNMAIQARLVQTTALAWLASDVPLSQPIENETWRKRVRVELEALSRRLSREPKS
jgi:hypothetical protein